MRKSLVITLFLILGLSAKAQFNLSENDPASTRWMSISSSNFKMIYPRFCDSLARVYLQELEYYRPRVANSLGMVSGQFQSRPLDVIMHVRNGASNGLVGWTPSRMEVQTIPEWNQAGGMLWVDMLAVHEGRHAAQMQAGYRRVFRPFRYILGQLVPGAVSAYPGTLLSEGDAVVAETALTRFGRGRDPRFLGRYMYSFDNNDLRSYPRWRYGSIYRPAPNNYALGYAMVSGARIAFDAPYFMADYLDYVARRPYDPWPLRHTLRRNSGNKFRQNFRDVMAVHYEDWLQDAQKRGPFTPSHQLSMPVKRKTEYSNGVNNGDVQLWVKSDIYHNPRLVSIDSLGREKRIAAVPSYMGGIGDHQNQSRIFWSELRNDPRWGQVNHVVIREYNLETRHRRYITRKHTNISPVQFTDSTIIAIHYDDNEAVRLVELAIADGTELRHLDVPSGIQPYMLDYDGSHVYMLAVTKEGMGLWRCTENAYEVLLQPVPVIMEDLMRADDALCFSCNLNGVMEFYMYRPQSNRLYQLTSTLYGGLNFNYCVNGDVSFTQYEGRGEAIKVVKKDSLLWKEVDWSNYHRYAVADKLSLQEDTLVFDQRLRKPRKLDMKSQTEFSEPQRYRKAGHFLRIHSWAPLYVNQDAIEDISMESVQRLANLGATVWFQNSASTFYGNVAYKAAKDFERGKWFHSGHLKLTYTGLYPVFEFSADVNERNMQYVQRQYFRPFKKDMGLYRDVIYNSDLPFVQLNLRSYIPWRWSRGTHYLGLVPSVSLSFNNDRYFGKPTFLARVGVRGYVMSPTPEAAVYPRWGLGAEAQWLDPYGLFYLYAYVPGIAAGQGVKLSFAVQSETELQTSQLYVGGYKNMLPRGFANAATLSQLYRSGISATVDYAIPFDMGDWYIGTAFYCKRGIITPFFDYSRLQAYNKTYRGGSLYSAGLSFEMDFGAFFWVKTPVRLGFMAAFNGGDATTFNNIADRLYVGPIFSVTLPN